MLEIWCRVEAWEMGHQRLQCHCPGIVSIGCHLPATACLQLITAASQRKRRDTMSGLVYIPRLYTSSTYLVYQHCIVRSESERLWNRPCAAASRHKLLITIYRRPACVQSKGRHCSCSLFFFLFILTLIVYCLLFIFFCIFIFLFISSILLRVVFVL